MANFAYKRTETTALKAVGIIDIDRMVIDIDGVEKSIATLLSDFNGGLIELNVKIKNEQDLLEPTSDDEEDESE